MPKPTDFGVNLRAARLRVFVLFEHHHAGAFAQHETVAILVPRTGCRCRIVIARRQRARRRKAAETERRHGRFRTARDHHVGVAVFDQAAGRADAVQARGTGGDDRQIRAFACRT